MATVKEKFKEVFGTDPSPELKNRLNLIKNKLYMLKEEINLKQMMRAKTVDYSEEKGRSL